MILEQGEVVDEIIAKIRAGRINRRTFLERAVAVGLSSTAAVSLLEACGGTSNSTGGNGQTVNVNYIEKDTNGVYAGLVKPFNSRFPWTTSGRPAIARIIYQGHCRAVPIMVSCGLHQPVLMLDSSTTGPISSKLHPLPGMT